MIEKPDIFYTPVSRKAVPRIADPRHPTDDEASALNERLARMFVGWQMTPEVLGEIKAAMREAGLDPDSFDYEFDEDAGELVVRPKPKCIKSVVVLLGESSKAANGVAGVSSDVGDGRRCILGRTDPIGCDHLCGRKCTGVCFPTYPPKYDDCAFL